MSCAQRVEGVWRSRCKRCGAKLVRVQRKWRETAKVDVLALRQQLLRYLDERYAIVDQDGADLRGAFFKRGDACDVESCLHEATGVRIPH